MSRSGYVDDDDDGMLHLWRGNVDRAIRGKRGQAFLLEMAAALDAMPVKELITNNIVDYSGQVCAIGAVAKARGLDVSKVDEGDGEEVGRTFGIARHLAQEIAYMNDERGPVHETPAARWQRMREWVDRQIRKATPPNSEGDPK